VFSQIKISDLLKIKLSFIRLLIGCLKIFGEPFEHAFWSLARLHIPQVLETSRDSAGQTAGLACHVYFKRFILSSMETCLFRVLHCAPFMEYMRISMACGKALKVVVAHAH
jgi:hypothetical protein